MKKYNLSLSAISWISFDAGSTVFYSGITGYFFPIWLVSIKGASDSDFALTITMATAITLLAGPTLGKIMDIYFTKRYFVFGFTLITCLFILFYGLFSNIFVILLLFACSLVFLNFAETFL